MGTRFISWISRSEKRSTKPKWIAFRSSRGFICFVVTIAVFTDVFLYGMIVPVTPTALQQKVGLSSDHEQKWTSILLALYAAALLAVSPVSGYLADRMQTRRWPLLTGLVALAASTSLLCVGNTLGLWIAGRIFQGASAAVVWTVGLALLVDTVGKESLGQFLGYTSMGLSLGAMTGPLLGGVIYQSGGYYAVFATAFAVIGVDIVLRLALIEKRHAAPWLESEKVSREEQVTHYSQETKSVATEADRTAIAEKPVPAVLRLLASPRLLSSLWSYFIIALLLASFDAVLPLYVQDTFGWEQTGQGLIFIPMSIPQLINPAIGAFIDRYPGSRRYLGAGSFVCSVPVYVLLRLVTHNSMQQKILLCALLTLLGVCIAVLIPVIILEINEIVEEEEKKSPESFGKGGAVAQAYGMSNAAFAAGSLAGPFFAGYIRTSAGWGTMAWTLGLLSGVTGLPVVLTVGGWIGTKSTGPAVEERVEA
ncbi:hypothetical protein ASPZODRAFT_17877 [Penicilliopsis zonata CBS 506.65]|uniref:Major facilitator superfamily (MFS) profile domain-containing protein n=1 Tax=Penicilliopsis zonata CBS 506.65 TaxID=1073090 RepID=A0A1L9SD05_9EURO|nr:hypothetical protein ASPZODRAFT_17877 [Penicilliopsis zonata CBS 506.65]OJJ44967.1 hypothetical protein ASPZODRAFT_17877 [Penicilliopsis zonata CBS 506.65]